MPDTRTGDPGEAAVLAEDAPPTSGTAPTAEDAPTAAGPLRVRAERWTLVLTALVAVLTIAVAAVDVSFPGRAVLALLFTLAVPGVPLASLLRVPNALLAASLAGALSIATWLLVATAALSAGLWNPMAWSAGVAAVGILATVPALRRLRSGAAATGPHEPVAVRRPRWTGMTVVDRPAALLMLVGALVLWWLATRWVDLDAAGASGVIGVVGWAYVLAFVLVAGAIAGQLLRRTLDPLMLAASAVVFAFMIFAFVNVAEGQASVPTGWLHVGFAQYITDHHASFHGLDARAEWPAFFAAAAQLVRLAGVPDASAFLLLSPFFYNAAAIAPLLVIARCITRSQRLSWLAVFIYLGANWVQQDYFSPQATAFLLHLTVLATVLWAATAGGAQPLGGSLRSRLTRAWRRRPELPAGTTPGVSLAREAALVLIIAAVVVGHQLTPITLVMSLFVFAVTGWTRYRRLWLIGFLLFLAWFSYGATDFWVGHLTTVFGDLGKLGANFDSAVSSRVGSNETYQIMQNVRVGWSLLYGLLAVVGLWSIRRRPDAFLIGALAACAGGLVLMQSYGGEVALRSFLFAAPVFAPLAALALRSLAASRRRVRASRVVAVGLAGVVLAYGLLGTATRGVNVSFERVTPDDVAAADVLHARLHPGDTVGYIAPTGADGSDRIGDFVQVPLAQEFCGVPALECAVEQLPRFIELGRTQDAQESLVSGAPVGSTTALGDELVRRGLYTVVHRGDDAVLLERTAQGG